MYPVPPQHWRAAGCDPHSRQCVTVHLILLDDALAFLVLGDTEQTLYKSAFFPQVEDRIKAQRNIYHVYSTVLAVVDLVVSDDWTAVGPDLYSCQGIAVDVVSFDEASAVAENINTALIAIENGVAPI